MTREQLIADLEQVLSLAPKPVQEVQPLGLVIATGAEAATRILTGQCVAISRRYVEAIVRELRGEAAHA